MNVKTLKNDLAQCDKTLPIILSKDAEGNNYYKLERCSVGYYAPIYAWHGELSDNKESLTTHETVQQALILHSMSNLKSNDGLLVQDVLQEIETLGLTDDTPVILSKKTEDNRYNEGSPYRHLYEAYYDKEQGAYGWGDAAIYEEDELTKEFLEEEELVKEKMLFSIVLSPTN